VIPARRRSSAGRSCRRKSTRPKLTAARDPTSRRRLLQCYNEMDRPCKKLSARQIARAAKPPRPIHTRDPLQKEAQCGRFKYFLANGGKEGLVEHVRDWPGVHCVRNLLDGEPLEGLWFDRTKECDPVPGGRLLRRFDVLEPELSPSRREVLPWRRGLSPSRGELSPSRSEPSPSRRDLLLWRGDLSPSRRDFSSCRRDLSSSRRGGSSSRRELSLDRRELSQGRREVVPYRREPSASRNGLSPKRRDLLPWRKDLSPSQRELSPSQGELLPDRREVSPD
jgi:hypothetical protein